MNDRLEDVFTKSFLTHTQTQIFTLKMQILHRKLINLLLLSSPLII